MKHKTQKSQSQSKSHKSPSNYLFETIPSTGWAIFNYIASMIRTHETVYCSQAHIARKFGVTREYVNKLIKKLRAVGVLNAEYRHNRTSLYSLSSVVWDSEIRKRLVKYCPWLAFFAITLLSSSIVAHMNCRYTGGRKSTELLFSGKFTQEKYLNKFISLSISSLSPLSLSLSTNKGEPLQKRMVMEKPVIAPHVIRLKSAIPSLTSWGVLLFAGFDEATIEFVIDQYEKAKKYSHARIHNAFAWAMAKAKYYCAEQKLKPDWNLVSRLKEEYKFTDDKPLIHAKKEREEVKKEVKKETPLQAYRPYESKKDPYHRSPEQLARTERMAARYENQDSLDGERFLRACLGDAYVNDLKKNYNEAHGISNTPFVEETPSEDSLQREKAAVDVLGETPSLNASSPSQPEPIELEETTFVEELRKQNRLIKAAQQNPELRKEALQQIEYVKSLLKKGDT